MLTTKLTTAKLALADKHIQILENSRSTDKSETIAQQTTVALCNKPSIITDTNTKANSNQKSYATIAKGPTTAPRFPPKPILIARVDKNAPASFITEEKIDALLFNNNGPTVQQVKRSENKFIFSFRDEASRDKAQELLSQDQEQDMFQSVFAPHKTFPVLVRFHGLDGIQMIKVTKDGVTPEQEAALFNERVNQQEALMSKLVAANPDLGGHFVSLRFLHNRPDAKSSFVRLSIKSKTFREKLLKSGRLLLDNRSHVVIKVDPIREIKHCARCQKYGHTRNFCGAKIEVCGKCSEAHPTTSCTVQQPLLKCPNCSQSHTAGSTSCPARIRAIHRFRKYNSTE